MSGILAVVSVDPARPVERDLASMQSAMRSWGRDRTGVWHGAGVSLGHQLHVDTPESRHEVQPALDAASGWRIVADARLDNREEVLAALGAGAEAPGGGPMTDDQIILQAWVRWGEACLGRLVGAFAFVVWHETTRTLFAVRDHLGCRPLVYQEAGGRLLLASDVRALLAVEGVRAEPDAKALLAAVACYAPYHRDKTFVVGISQLEAGHLLEWNLNGLRLRRHWCPENLPVSRLRDLRECADVCLATIAMAVKAQLRTVHPLGVHLSGGLDSGGVAVLADELLAGSGRRLAGGYSWMTPPDAPEVRSGAEHARIAVLEQRLGLACRYCDLTPEDYEADFLRDPTREPTELTLYESKVGRLASADGVGVILSGWGGDEFVSFNARGFFADRFWGGRWWSLVQEIKRARGTVMGPAWHDAWAGRPGWLRGVGSLERIKEFDRTMPTWRDFFELEELQQAMAWRRGQLRGRSVRHTMLALGRNGHLAHRMAHWSALGGETGLQYRFPLLDRRVVEQALTMPDSFFLHRGMNRYGLRLALLGRLPPDYVWNSPKRDHSRMARLHALSVPFCQNLLQQPLSDSGLNLVLVRDQRQRAALFLALA